MRKAAREKMGTEGEDVVADPSGGLKLRMPMRMGIGTVKAAAWHVRFWVIPPTGAQPKVACKCKSSPFVVCLCCCMCAAGLSRDAADGCKTGFSAGWISRRCEN